MAKPRKSKEEKALEAKVDRIVKLAIQDVQIDIFDLSKISEEGMRVARETTDLGSISAAVKAIVERFGRTEMSKPEYVLLRGIKEGNRFFTTNTGDVTKLDDGTVAFTIIGYAETTDEAQIKLYGRTYHFNDHSKTSE